MKIDDDQWSPDGVVSTFRLRYIHRQAGRFPSDSCGFGWRFVCGTVAPNGYATGAAQWSSGEQVIFYVGFDSYLLKGSQLGKAIIQAKSSHTIKPLPSQRISLSNSASCYNSHTGSYDPGVDLGQFTFDNARELEEVIITFTVSLESPDVHVPTHPSPSTAARPIMRALTGAVSGAEMNDVEFVLPTSKRDGQAVEHKAVYGNREALKGVSDYLDTLLFDEHFAEAKPQPFGRFERTPAPHDLDYADDSDIDDDSAPRSNTHRADVKPKKSTGKGRSKAGSSGLPSSGSASGNGPPSTLVPSDGRSETSFGQGDFGARKGRVVCIHDFAFQTWQALVLFLYTGEITFCDLQSTGKRQSSAELPPTACSPKSMYRVAHMLELKELQDLCLKNIQSQLAAANIVAEVFSVFTSRYPEVSKIEIKAFKQYYTTCVDEREKMMLKVARGEVPHCGEVLNAFMAVVDVGDEDELGASIAHVEKYKNLVIRSVFDRRSTRRLLR